MAGDGGGGGQARGFDTYQLDDLRKFAVGFNHKISNAFAVGRNKFGAQAGVGELQVALLDFRNHVF